MNKQTMKYQWSIKMGFHPMWIRSNSGVSKPPCSIVAGGRDIAKFVLFKVICDLMKHQITSLFNVQFFPKRHKFLAAAGNISVWYLHVNKSWCLVWKSSGLSEIFRTRRFLDTRPSVPFFELNLLEFVAVIPTKGGLLFWISAVFEPKTSPKNEGTNLLFYFDDTRKYLKSKFKFQVQ